MTERSTWNVTWTCEKWRNAAEHRSGWPPYARLTCPGNLLLAVGAREILLLAMGLGGTTFGSGTATVYVGDGTTAPASAQTDLAGTNTADAAMDPGYPQLTDQTASWRGTFDGATANFDWAENGVKNGAGPPGGAVVLLNRRLVGFGSKTAGQVWSLTGTLTLA